MGTHKWEHKRCSLSGHQEVLLYCAGNVAQVAQRGWGICLHRDIQNTSVYGLGSPAVGDSVWAGGLVQKTSKDPFRPTLSLLWFSIDWWNIYFTSWLQHCTAVSKTSLLEHTLNQALLYSWHPYEVSNTEIHFWLHSRDGSSASWVTDLISEYVRIFKEAVD